MRPASIIAHEASNLQRLGQKSWNGVAIFVCGRTQYERSQTCCLVHHSDATRFGGYFSD